MVVGGGFQECVVWMNRHRVGAIVVRVTSAVRRRDVVAFFSTRQQLVERVSKCSKHSLRIFNDTFVLTRSITALKHVARLVTTIESSLISPHRSY